MPYPDSCRRFLLLALILLVPSLARALPEDRLAPVEIEADSAEIDQAHQLTRYRGHVKITQGSMELEADEVVVEYQGHEAKTITATGQPARFRQLPAKGKDWVRGQARRIVYRIDSDLVELTGQAKLTQNRDSFRSDRILYDRKAARLKAGSAAGGKQRVKVILHPGNARR